jgi:hypothetical protein
MRIHAYSYIDERSADANLYMYARIHMNIYIHVYICMCVCVRGCVCVCLCAISRVNVTQGSVDAGGSHVCTDTVVVSVNRYVHALHMLLTELIAESICAYMIVILDHRPQYGSALVHAVHARMRVVMSAYVRARMRLCT